MPTSRHTDYSLPSRSLLRTGRCVQYDITYCNILSTRGPPADAISAHAAALTQCPVRRAGSQCRRWCRSSLQAQGE